MRKSKITEQGAPSAFFDNNNARPAQQERSRRRHAELLQAGLALLRHKDFDDIPISAIVAQAGCAVGSFYTRFEDKQAYFGALQQHVLAQLEEQSTHWFASQPWQEMPLEQAIDHLIEWVVERIIEQRGIVRAAYKHNQNRPGVWTPMKAVGGRWTELASEHIAPRLAYLPAAQRQHHFRVAMQFLYGVMINAVINDPGPLALRDPKLPKALGRAFGGYLQASREP